MFSEVLYNTELLNDFEPEDIIEVFKNTTEVLAKEPAFIKPDLQEGKAVFVGDTHGDFSTTKYIVKRFLNASGKQYLVFLGDYVDREPEPEGSLWNLVYLCLLKINFPERVFLLKGNHEANYAVECFPYEFNEELIEIFGSTGVKIHEAAVSVFKEMPLMLQTLNGVVAAHGGFPMRGQKIEDKSREDLIMDILWADPECSPMFRGYGVPKFTEEQLINFLDSCGASCFIRGHDYTVAGKAIYSNKCITVFTCRRYAFKAGMTVAKVDLSRKVKDATDIVLEDFTSFLDTLI
ncbi:metallophosphoesterase family protein [Thermodesulfovibrio sp. 3907-1M]|uniref:Metallophosphoesterase family protein n=1 Tax=Thermodesulfovibrio autotrophicus TaxID=3118333 RepID=A0AAU8GTZ5_9BACT